MAKPKTKGDPIQVRLPLPTDTAVREQAARVDKTPAAIVEAIVVGSHRGALNSAKGQTAEPAKPAVILPDDPACTHPKAKVSVHPSGLGVCQCGATRGVDGEWR